MPFEGSVAAEFFHLDGSNRCTKYNVHDYLRMRPDQINCLFHGSGKSLFLALKNNWIGVALPATTQWYLGIVPCEQCMGSSFSELMIAANCALLKVAISTTVICSLRQSEVKCWT